MLRHNTYGKIAFYVFSTVIILTTAAVEYFGPAGTFLSWGYMVVIFITMTSGYRGPTLLAILLSTFFVAASVFYLQDDIPRRVLLLNRGYAFIGIAIAAWVAFRVLRREARAHHNKTQMEGIFSHGTQGIILMREDGAIVLGNPFSEKLFGYTAEELQDTRITALIPGIDIAQQLNRGGNETEAREHFQAKRKDHTLFYAEISLNRYPSAGTTYIVAFIIDITWRVQHAEKLRAQKLAVESINKELEAFSYSVSHDLRAPLRAVGGYARMLEEDYTAVLEGEGNRLLRIIRESAEQMGILIDDLLAFSRLGKKEIRKTVVNMTEKADATLYELNKTVSHRAEVIIGQLHPAMADSALVGHVLTNLLSNALKYSSKKEHPRVEILSEEKDGAVIYKVRDNGAGFEMEYADKLFGVFQRLHSQDDFEGTGVGLAIAHRIIQKHGGKIWAEGIPGAGATFYFTLPGSLTANSHDDNPPQPDHLLNPEQTWKMQL